MPFVNGHHEWFTPVARNDTLLVHYFEDKTVRYTIYENEAAAKAAAWDRTKNGQIVVWGCILDSWVVCYW